MNSREILLFLLFGALFVSMIIWHCRRANSIFIRWAEERQYRIIERVWRPIRAGPYFFRKSRGQEVFRIVVEDAGGNRRSGYVRVGGFLLGMLSTAVDVTWDDER